jgi:hypothetical protein
MKMACLSLVSCLLWCAELGRADSLPAIRNEPADLSSSLSGGTAWTFYVQTSIKVTGIGYYDHGRDGLFNEQRISIWRDTSGQTAWPFIDPYSATLISMTTIPSGTNAELFGSWRRVNFDVALTLEPGGYEIAKTNVLFGDDFVKVLAIGFDTPQLDPRIQLGAPAGNIEHLPPDQYITTFGASLGPVFFVEVPEPSSAVIVLIGSVAVLAHRRLRR